MDGPGCARTTERPCHPVTHCTLLAVSPTSGALHQGPSTAARRGSPWYGPSRSNDESSSTELVTHKSERSPDRAVLAGDDAPSMGDFSAACNHETGRNPRRLRTGNSEWAQVRVLRCSLQLKPCSVFIVAAVPIPTALSTSRTSNRGSCQTMAPSYSSHRGHPLALPVTVVPIPKAWFPPGNCTKQGPTHVPRWLSPLVVMVHYT